MSAYKKLNRQNVYVSDYVAKKAWYATGSVLSDYGIETMRGFSGSTPGFPYPYDVWPKRSQKLVFSSINQLYYGNTLGSNNSGSTVLSGSYNISETTTLDLSGSRIIKNEVAVISIPHDVYGTGIEPGTVRLEHFTQSADKYNEDNYVIEPTTGRNQFVENVKYWYNSHPIDTRDYLVSESSYVYENETVSGSYLGDFLIVETGSFQDIVIIDDGEGRLIISGAENPATLPERHVGDVIYNQGQLILTDEVVARYYSAYSRHKLNWKSKQPIYTYNVHCTVKESELNFTFNPSATTGSQKHVTDNITGSQFRPYVSAIGLYNDASELVAVAKTNRPIPKSENVDMTFIVKLDI